MEENAVNPLLSSSKVSDSQLQVQLHPLVILIISDYVTRHTLRQQTGPVVGAIIGAQNGREITMEHAFECKLEQNKNGDTVLDAGWFHDRLQQYKDVHKSSALDLVGWFALTPTSGPQEHHLPIHQQLIEQYNESALLLAFHPDAVADGTSKGSKLPITIYETAFEASTADEDKHMQSSDDAGPQLVLRFKELPYTIETGEAEMIGVDFVAKGGANATVTNGTTAPTSAPSKTDSKGKGKGRIKQDNSKNDMEPNLDILSQEDEELISSLTAKANAIRMLQQRISLMKAYLNSLPPCYLNTPHSQDEQISISPHPQISHTVLRTISATLARLPLLSPPAIEETSTRPNSIDLASFSYQSAQQRSDVALVSLLGALGSTARNAQDMGRKALIVERSRSLATQTQPGGFGNAGGKLGKLQSTYMASGAGDRHGGMSELSSVQGDEGYVDDFEDGADESDGRGGFAAGGGGGVPLSEAWKRFANDDEMAE